jgi:opacity protein-like surface antigen
MKNSSKKLLLVTAVATAMFSSTAMADMASLFKGQSAGKDGTLPTNQFKIELEGGYGGMELPSSSDVFGSRTNSGFSGRASVGMNFALTPSFLLGPEVGYAMVPSAKYQQSGLLGSFSSKWSANYADALAAAQFNITPQFAFLAKAGVAWINQNVEVSGTAPGIDESGTTNNTKYVPEAVVGLGFKPSTNFMVTLTYSQLFADGTISDSVSNISGNSNKVASIGNAMLGLSLLF